MLSIGFAHFFCSSKKKRKLGGVFKISRRRKKRKRVELDVFGKKI